MLEFIFMLTKDDVTVEDALEVYEEVRDAGLHYVGFKDVGPSFAQLKELTDTIHNGGQEVMLEVVSERKEDELRSARAAVELGVNYLLGGSHAQEVTEILDGTDIRVSSGATSRRSWRAPGGSRPWIACKVWTCSPTASTATWARWCKRWSRRSRSRLSLPAAWTTRGRSGV